MSTDPEFEELVQLDVKGDTSVEQIEYLRDNLESWIDCLNSMLRDVDIQFTSHKASLAAKYNDISQKRSVSDSQEWHDGLNDQWHEAVAKNLDWKLKANRYKASIESRLRYAKSLRVS